MSGDKFPVPTRPCEPWCRDASDGKEHVTSAPADRWCWTPLTEVPMTLARPVQMGDGTWSYDWLDLGLVRQNETGHDATTVLIHNEGGSEWFLTLDEARRVHELLGDLIGLADHDDDTEGQTVQ